MDGGVDGIDPGAKPGGRGCVECLASGGCWLHLRQRTGHPVISSFEPGESCTKKLEESTARMKLTVNGQRNHFRRRDFDVMELQNDSPR